MRRLLWAAALALLTVAPARGQRTVAVTFDDLPYVGAGTLAEAEASTDALLAALAAFAVPADLFVTGDRVERDGETAARRALLRRWLSAGHALHNHSYSHPRASETDPDAYLADVARGWDVVASVLDEAGQAARPAFFRPPYNDLGTSDTTRARLAASLAGRGVRLAPFTVEHGDYAFDAVYRDALARDDTALARRVGIAYLEHLDVAVGFAETLSTDTFGREIPQVLLLHANRINADHLDAMLARLRARDYGFVTLDEAMRDPAYASRDAYLRKWGVSWLHRWRVALELPNRLRDEPEMPARVFEAYQAL